MIVFDTIISSLSPTNVAYTQIQSLDVRSRVKCIRDFSSIVSTSKIDDAIVAAFHEAFAKRPA
jgi:hypothetical protein